jgi:hypothetical protein
MEDGHNKKFGVGIILNFGQLELTIFQHMLLTKYKCGRVLIQMLLIERYNKQNKLVLLNLEPFYIFNLSLITGLNL